MLSTQAQSQLTQALLLIDAKKIGERLIFKKKTLFNVVTFKMVLSVLKCAVHV